MHRLPRSFILLCALLAGTVQAQERLLLGIVLDGNNDRPIEGVHITVVGREFGMVSDPKGRFEVPIPSIGPMILSFSHVSYSARSIEVFARDRLSIPMEFRLAPGVTELPVVEIRRPGPEVVYQRPDLHVGDYRVNDDGLWVLVYERPRMWHRQDKAGQRIFMGARLHRLDRSFNELAVVNIPGEVRGLHTDHRNAVIIEGVDLAWKVETASEGIVLHEMELRCLRDEVLPITDSLAGFLIGNNRSENYPAFDHFRRDPYTNEDRLLCSVKDAHSLELFRSQYKYMSGHDKVVAMDMALRTGIDKELIAGFMTGFQKDPYFRVPYAPLFLVGGKACVFDHERAAVALFSDSFEPVGKVPLTHHLNRAWRKELIQDPTNGKIYGRFGQGERTWLCTIDPFTGAVGEPHQLLQPWPEDLRVHGGNVYYVYRTHASTQHRTLYRERL